MDVTPYLELSIAPRAIFDSLEERRDQVRFWVPRPGAPLDIQGCTPVTYGAFAEEIRDCACFLAGVLNPGDRAAIFAPNRVEWASAALGIQAAGGVMVPVYPASTPSQLAYVASHSDARVLFVDTPALLQKVFEVWPLLAQVDKIVLLGGDLDIPRILDKLREGGKAAPPEGEVRARLMTFPGIRAVGRASHQAAPSAFEEKLRGVSLDRPGMMLYTSGTSGDPKGVPLTHRNVGSNGRDWLMSNGSLIPERAVDVLWLPMSHIFGFGEMCLGNTLGMTTYLSDPASCLALLPLVRPQVFMSVPSHWEKLAAPAMAEPTACDPKKKLLEATGGELAFCLSGGAGLKREVKEFYHAAGILIIEGYGLTETSPTLTLNRPDAFRFDTVGRPLPSVTLKLAEDSEILAKGPNVFGGYHKDPAATREAFTEDGWFKTGDVGRFTEDGFLQIVDRKKDILVTAGGKNVPPANIELKFQGDARILHVVVYGEAKKYLVCGVWLNDAILDAELAGLPEASRLAERERLVQQKIDQVNAELAHHETLRAFAIIDAPLTVESGLLTASFKVRRKRVHEAFRSVFEGLYERPREKASPGKRTEA